MLPDICLTSSKSDFNALGGSAGISGGPGDGSLNSDGTLSHSGNIGATPCQRPVISAVSMGRKTLTIDLKRPDGSILDLTNAGSVSFVAKETFDAAQYYIDKTMTIIDGTAGRVELDLQPSDIPYAGVWLSGVVIANADGDQLIQYDVYLHISRSLRETDRTNVPISMADVRMALADRCDADNDLLDSVEFSDAEICWAIQRVVDEWNECPPQIDSLQYTAATFPWRRVWAEAAAAELLRMAARNLIRNKLDYNAGGLNVQDKARGPIYAQMAEGMRNEFKDWMRRKKYSLNAERCYSTTKSRIYY